MMNECSVEQEIDDGDGWMEVNFSVNYYCGSFYTVLRNSSGIEKSEASENTQRTAETAAARNRLYHIV